MLAHPGSLALVSVVVCLALLLWRPEDVADQDRILSLSSLTRTNGVFYVEGEAHPFNGVALESYRSGGRKAVTEIQNGVAHGLSEGFYTNGVLQIREMYQHGVLHGERSKFWSNGNLKSQGRAVDGAWEGVFRKWHESGGLAQELTMKRGAIHGWVRAWDASGALLSETNVVATVPGERQVAWAASQAARVDNPKATVGD